MMKKLLCLFVTLLTCISLLTACSFFTKKGDPIDTGTTTVSKEETTTEKEEEDDTSTEDISTEEATSTTTETEPDNPRDNVATDAEKEFTATGIYCGFIDSNSVEIELSDGSYCSFFAFDEDVRNTLSSLNEEDMPSITFTYKAREGQVNPEMTSVEP